MDLHNGGLGAGLTFEQQKELLMLQHQQEQQSLEHYRIELVRDGKFSDSFQSNPSGSSCHFDVATNLKLVPSFSEKDPDTFFLLFERLAKTRKWTDTE